MKSRKGAESALVSAVPAYTAVNKIVCSRGYINEENGIKDTSIIHEGERMSLNAWREAGVNVDWQLKNGSLVQDGYIEIKSVAAPVKEEEDADAGSDADSQ